MSPSAIAPPAASAAYRYGIAPPAGRARRALAHGTSTVLVVPAA